MNTLRLILRRLLSGIGVLWGAATLTFLAINLSAGDPALAILGGPEAMPSAELIAQVRAEYGLDQPLIVQYGQYLGRLAQADLGDSYRLRIPVGQVIAGQLGATVQLSLAAAALAVLLAVLVAVTTANRAPWIRSLVSGTELVLSSAPSFVIGLGLLLAFAFGWHLLPPSGSKGWQALILPSVALALPVAAVLSQVLRQELEDILEQPFIAMARARGTCCCSTCCTNASWVGVRSSWGSILRGLLQPCQQCVPRVGKPRGGLRHLLGNGQVVGV